MRSKREQALPLDLGLDDADTICGDRVQVVIDVSTPELPQPLTYLAPPEVAGRLRFGSTVLVPLRGREQIGYVVGLGEEAAAAPASPSVHLRPIAAVLREESAFEPSLFALAEWVARETHTSIEEALHAIAPESQMLSVRAVVRLAPSIRERDPLAAGPPGWGRALAGVAERLLRALREAGGSLELEALRRQVPEDLVPAALRRMRRAGWIVETREVAPPRVRARTIPGVGPAPDLEPAVRLGPQQQRVLEHVRSLPDSAFPLAQRDLCAALGVGAESVRSLIARGLLVPEAVRVSRVTKPPRDLPPQPPPELLPEQAGALDRMGPALRSGRPESFLLFGVTGSGKTEIYLRACEQVLAAGRRAIYLVPEISLTAQVVEQFRARFGDRVGLIHSRLSDGERYDEWERIRRGEVEVVLGPRSALFAPARDVGLIVVDEEHDSSYKQDSAPRYLARDVAARRGELENAVLVLGSATPAVETFYRAQQGEIGLIRLPERVLGRPLPEVEVVDLRAETRARPGLIFGARLEEAVREALARGEQAILFLNRRGFSTFVLCRDCGYVARCPNCNVALTLHQERGNRLLCHHCAHIRRAPTTCPRCSGTRIRHFGIGTERVEAAACDAFPGARIVRLDRDTTSRKDSHARIVNQFREREADLLIGTQMVAKGFDFPDVTLVGVITADTALNLPDFRAAERTFQLLSQVSGRSGRGERLGRVVIQTFAPDHFSIQAAAAHDYEGFYRQEIVNREELEYPPFTALARLVIADPSEETARGKIHRAAQLLAPEAATLGVRMLGPCSAPLTRINRKYRWHLLLKARTREAVQQLLRASLRPLRQHVGAGLAIDVDPQSLL
jgi:primosomal protein N' (replication factor Y)